MAVKHFQIGRGTYDKAVVYTGLIGELILDTTNMQVRVHDGETMGGYPIAKDVLATSSARGLMAPEDKAKLDTLQNYVLPTAGLNKLGGVKTTSTVTSASGYTACPIISGVPYYANIPAVSLYIGAVDAKADAATSNGATYLKLFSDNTLSKQFNIKGSGATTVTSDASGSLIINSVNTTYTAATNAPLAPGTAAVGTSAKYAREDHVHPVQTTISGNAGTATKLANGAKIGISGAVTGTATLFDGSADITIPTTGIDVSKANAGTLPVSRGGTGQTSVANIQAGKDAAGNVITNTYATKTELNNLRSGLVQTVSALPETGTEGIIYLVPNATDPSTYDQFTWENGAYVPLGNTSFNLGDYVKKENVVTSLSISGRTITYTKGDGTTGTLTTQDNNTTYSAGTGLSLSGTTFSVSSTAGSSALSWGTEVTLGTVGGLAIKAKLPANPNSDTKVTQNISTTSSTYPVLLTPTANANANVGASTAIFGAGIKANPSTGELIATKFTGALAGNANTATKATQDSAGQQINTTYIKGLSVSGKTITYTKGDGTTGTITTQDTNTTYSVATTSANGLMSADDKAKLDGLSNYVLPTAANGILGGVKTSSTVTSASGYTACPIIDGIPYYKDTNTTYTLSSLGIGNVKNYDQSKAISSITRSGTTFTYTCLDGTTGTFTQQDNNTTYSNMTAATADAAGKAGLVPAPAAGKQTAYLRGDGTWQVPPNTTYSNFVKSGSGAKAGLVPAPSTTAGTTKYLREDGTWSVPPDTNTTYTFTAGTSTLAWNSEVTLATVGGLAIKAKLPANPNSDTKVTQNISTTNNTYPVLLTPTANATANVGANTAIFGSGIKANPSTGELIATKFTGALSGTATKATQDSAGQQINTTYIKGLSVSGRTITYTKGDGTTGTITTQDTNTTYTFTAGTSALSWNTEVTLATVGGLAIKAKLPANPNTNTTYSAGAGLALSGTTFSVTALPSRSTPIGNGLTYCTGGLTIGTANGNLFKGSSNNANLVSAPENGTFYTDTQGNVQNLRLTWSTDGKYLTDIFASPNNDYLWHRNVVNGTAKGWRRLVEENVSGITAPTWNISVSGTATKATQDSAGQQINTTYIKGLSVSGRTITYTKGDGTTGTITTQDSNTWTAFKGATSSAAGTAGYVPAPAAGDQAKFFRADGTWQTPANTTYSNFVKSGSGAKAGLVPAPSTTAGTTHYLREDGTWSVPPDTNTTYSVFVKSGSGAKAGLVPAPSTTAGATKYLREDGAWQVPPNTTYTFTAGTSTLAWNSEVTLATVGGLAIKAKLPANPNSDTKVTQNISTANSTYPVLLTPTANATANVGATTAIFGSGIKANPSTGELIATKFTGAFSGNASTATKLATARSISVGNKDFVGSANFDGSGNITLNVMMDWCRANLDKTNHYPYHRIATTNVVTGNFQDYTVMLLINKAYTTGGYGIIRIALRTESGTTVASAEAQWVTRTADMPVDCIQLGLVNTPAKAVVDVFYKAGGVYQAVQVRALGHSSNRYQNVGIHGFTLISGGEDGASTATDPKTSTECWATLAAAATALGRGSYTSTITASDTGVAYRAGNVTGTVAIANGGTGATTRLNAIKNLTNENISTNATHFLGLKSDWSKVGYFTLAEAKTLLGLKSAAYAETSAFAAASHTHSYLPLSGGTLTGDVTIQKASPVLYLRNTSKTRGTAPSAAVNVVEVNGRDNANKNTWGIYQTYNTDKSIMTYLITYKGTTTDNTWTGLGIGYDASGNVVSSAPTPAVGDSSTKIATTAWVKTATGNTTLNAANVTGTVAIAHGGTGATDRLNALKNLTNEAVETNAQYFLTITSNWAKGGYSTVASVKSVLGLKSAAYAETSAFAAASHTHSYLPLSGGTLTGQLIINRNNSGVGGGLRLTGASQNYAISIINTGVTKGTKPTEVKYTGIDFYGSTVSNYKNRLGMVEYMLDTTNASAIHLRAYNCTSAENAATSTISAIVDGSGNAYTAAPHPAFGDHSTKIATTAWVHDNALYTKRSGMDSWSFITSNSSMTNGSMSSATSMAFAMVASNSDLTTNLVNGKKIGGVGMYASGTSKMSGLKVAFYTSTTAASEAGFDMFTTGNPGSQKVSVLFRHGGKGEVFGPSPSWSSALSANEDTGTVLLGSTHYLWKQVCAKSATIATSDERLKTQIAPIPDEILDAWGDLQYSQFKWIDTVEKEGEAARLHVGAVAQAVERMFQSKGIDVTKYSFFCHTPEEPYEWTEEVEVEPGVKEEKVVKGVHPDRYALRYADMLVIEAVYQRRRADRLEARLSRIEKALNLD